MGFYNYNDGVYLNLLPVCECGEILRDAYACEVIETLANKKVNIQFLNKKVDINPACCPFCGQTIRGFQIKNEYLNMFEG